MAQAGQFGRLDRSLLRSRSQMAANRVGGRDGTDQGRRGSVSGKASAGTPSQGLPTAISNPRGQSRTCPIDQSANGYGGIIPSNPSAMAGRVSTGAPDVPGGDARR